MEGTLWGRPKNAPFGAKCNSKEECLTGTQDIPDGWSPRQYYDQRTNGYGEKMNPSSKWCSKHRRCKHHQEDQRQTHNQGKESASTGHECLLGINIFWHQCTLFSRMFFFGLRSAYASFLLVGRAFYQMCWRLVFDLFVYITFFQLLFSP